MAKKKPTKFTFRRHKRETGLAAVGRPWPPVDIKLDGLVVGWIQPPNWRRDSRSWNIWLRIVSETSKAEWDNRKLKQTFETEEDARAFLNHNFETIVGLNLSPDPDPPQYD